MVFYIKNGMGNTKNEEVKNELIKVVQKIIHDIDIDGDMAVRKYSDQFDHWSPGEFRLTPEMITDILDTIPAQVRDDIEFSQQQVCAASPRSSVRPSSILKSKPSPA